MTAAEYNAKLNDPNTSIAEAERLIATMPIALKRNWGLPDKVVLAIREN